MNGLNMDDLNLVSGGAGGRIEVKKNAGGKSGTIYVYDARGGLVNYYPYEGKKEYDQFIGRLTEFGYKVQ